MLGGRRIGGEGRGVGGGTESRVACAEFALLRCVCAVVFGAANCVWRLWIGGVEEGGRV